MRTLIVGPYTAVLDAETGLGVLVLPCPCDLNRPPARRMGGAVPAATRRWFGGSSAEADYQAVLRQLPSIGWRLADKDLPPTSWVKVGETNCCQRTMMSLNSVDVDHDLDVQKCIDVFLRFDDLVVWSCCAGARLQEAARSVSR